MSSQAWISMEIAISCYFSSSPGLLEPLKAYATSLARFALEPTSCGLCTRASARVRQGPSGQDLEPGAAARCSGGAAGSSKEPQPLWRHTARHSATAPALSGLSLLCGLS